MFTKFSYGLMCSALLVSMSACGASSGLLDDEAGDAGDMVQSCDPQDASAEGACTAIVPGYAWDGVTCRSLGSGCNCVGSDCGDVFEEMSGLFRCLSRC